VNIGILALPMQHHSGNQWVRSLSHLDGRWIAPTLLDRPSWAIGDENESESDGRVQRLRTETTEGARAGAGKPRQDTALMNN
jgi:hypothetical protein